MDPHGPTQILEDVLRLISSKPFLTSPRNSAAVHRSLYKTLKCNTLVSTDSKSPTLDAVQPRCLIVPTIDEMLVGSIPFRYDKPSEVGRWDPLVIWCVPK